MDPAHRPTRAEFESLVSGEQEVVRLVNRLEYALYLLGERADPDRVTECQQAAGALIGTLRPFLFQLDQRIFPLLDEMTAGEGSRDAANPAVPAAN